MKRLLALILALAATTTICLASCDKKDDTTNPSDELVDNTTNNTTNNGGENNTGDENNNNDQNVVKEFEAKSDTVYVLFPANIRAEASTSSTALGTANYGDSFTRTGSNGTWSRIEIDGTTAYIFEDVLTTNKASITFTAYEEANYVTVYANVENTLNLRNTPWVPEVLDSYSNVEAIVKAGGELIKIGESEDGSWAQVKLGAALVEAYPKLADKTLYVKTKYLSTTKPGEEASNDNTNTGDETPAPIG